MENQNKSQSKPAAVPKAPINTKKLFVHMRNPEKLVFEGEADAISSVNDQGPFDVLPSHGNFISIIRQRIALYNKGQKPQEFPIVYGILKVLENRVTIFLGIEALKS